MVARNCPLNTDLTNLVARLMFTALMFALVLNRIAAPLEALQDQCWIKIGRINIIIIIIIMTMIIIIMTMIIIIMTMISRLPHQDSYHLLLGIRSRMVVKAQ